MPKKKEPIVINKKVVNATDDPERIVAIVAMVEWNERPFLVITKKYRRGTEEDPEFYGGFWFPLDDGEMDVEQLVNIFNAAGELLGEEFDLGRMIRMELFERLEELGS